MILIDIYILHTLYKQESAENTNYAAGISKILLYQNNSATKASKIQDSQLIDHTFLSLTRPRFGGTYA